MPSTITTIDLAQSKPLDAFQPKIAIASSGLGHIQRGIETWALDLARALNRADQDVTLFQGAGEPREAWQVNLNCARRFDPRTVRRVDRLRRFSAWRYGFGSVYQAEQTSFAMRLWPKIRRDFDILHVQDPWVALILDRLHRAGLSRPAVILAHGTEEPTNTLRKYSHLQHLAPCYLQTWAEYKPNRQNAFAIGNFVDTELFRPGDQREMRRQWEIPQDHFVVLCVAAIKKTHKRVDYLLREFAEFSKSYSRPATLVVAGSREVESDEVMSLGKELLGDRVMFLQAVPRDRIPGLYQAADIFALASLHEMMPIAVLEALSSGLPVACNNTPTLAWMVGRAGHLSDLSLVGGMATQLLTLSDAGENKRLSREARKQAENEFSEQSIVRQILSMYRTVLGDKQ